MRVRIWGRGGEGAKKDVGYIDPTESLKTVYKDTVHQLSRIQIRDVRFTVGSGKCIFGYEDGKNERNRWHNWIPHLQI